MKPSAKKNAVVAGLVAIALGYHAWNLFGKKATPLPAAGSKPGSTNSLLASSSKSSSTSTNSTKGTTGAPLLAPEKPIDDSLILTSLSVWTESPKRDPFEVRTPAKIVRDDTPPASSLLTVQALWRQTGGHLAVVNDHVHVVGDVVRGFRIEEIQESLIWVRGTKGRERVDLKAPHLNPVANPSGASATNNRASQPKTQRSPAVSSAKRNKS